MKSVERNRNRNRFFIGLGELCFILFCFKNRSYKSTLCLAIALMYGFLFYFHNILGMEAGIDSAGVDISKWTSSQIVVKVWRGE